MAHGARDGRRSRQHHMPGRLLASLALTGPHCITAADPTLSMHWLCLLLPWPAQRCGAPRTCCFGDVDKGGAADGLAVTKGGALPAVCCVMHGVLQSRLQARSWRTGGPACKRKGSMVGQDGHSGEQAGGNMVGKRWRQHVSRGHCHCHCGANLPLQACTSSTQAR